MTGDPIAAHAIAYTGPRRARRESTGPMTQFGRHDAAPQDAERAPVRPDRP